MANYTYETVRIQLKSGLTEMKAEEDYREVIQR